MKSRLLLLFLLVFSFANAQVATFNSVLNSYNITATTASINNTITSNSNFTVYYQLATGNAGNVALSPTYGGSTNATGTWVVPFNLSGLTPNTTYYFRFRADNASGTSYSTTGSFTTLSAVPSITSVSTSATYNSATVFYSLNANGYATTSTVRYGLTSGSLTSQVTGFSASGTSVVSYYVNIAGLLPNTTYYYQIEATNAIGTAMTTVGSFMTPPQTPGIAAISSSSITTNSATINYSVWDKELSTTTLVRYGLTSGNLTMQVSGFSVSGNTTVSSSVNLNGLQASTTYYYRVEATNSAGTELSSIYSFTTASLPLVLEYSFDNTYTNLNGNTPFADIPGTTSFVADRNAVASKALQVVGNTNNGTFCNALAPTGSNPRTISFWYKTPSHAGYKSLFSYGTANQYQTFGAYFGTNGNIILQGYSYDYDFGGSYALNTWRHLVITFDGANAKLYMNGTLVGTTPRPLLNTGTGTNFRIGNNSITMQFDDLKIFNYVISDADITSLYNNNTLSSSDFNQNNLKLVLYPNPVQEVLNIQSETNLKSIEIYNLQGQKVLETSQNQINISNLKSGVYMVRIEDENSGVATKRIIKE